MKILGIVLGCFVVVIGASVGIFALKGGFTKEKIDIVDLILNKAEDTEDTSYDINDSNTKLTIYTMADVTTSVSFAPLEATEKDLLVTVTGIDGVLANKEELSTGITAGEDFKIKIRKDSLGNNHGGVVKLTIKSPNGLARVEIVVIVDVPIPSNTIYFSGDNNNRITTTGKAFTLAKNTNNSYVYLKSELYNAFSLNVSGDNLTTATGNLKEIEISYVYTSLDKSWSDEHTYLASELEIIKGVDSLTHTTSYYYKIPIIPQKSGTIVFTAKTHRSYGIQKEFEESGFNDMEAVFNRAKIAGALEENKVKANALRDKFSSFVNKYIAYFDDTEESKYFFLQHVDKDGKIAFTEYDSALKALKYVYVSCTAEVDVTAVNLDKITSSSGATSFNVFESVDFSKNSFEVNGANTIDVVDKFGLAIRLKGENGETVSGADDEENTLFDTLEMGAYIYLPKGEGEEDAGAEMGLAKTSNSYDEVIPVYGFDENDKPITPYVVETYPANEKDNYVEEIGYLYKIKPAMTSNKYMDINSSKSGNNTYWTVTFNVPLLEVSSEETITKALYFRFAVSGVDLNNKMAKIDRETFSRVYIDYTRYKYADSASSMLTLKSSENTALNNTMALNTSLENATGYAQSKQNVIVDTSSSAILNYSSNYYDASSNTTVKEVEYKSIMYFVETESNTLDGGAKQVATLGKYNFIDITTGSTYLNGEKLLEGERIPTYVASNSVKQFYIQTLNASPLAEAEKTPVKVFAVVYLSDRYGNPITLNGERIVVEDELEPEEATMLYVVEISDLSAHTIYIDNFVDTVNFYTQMADTITLCKDSENLNGGIVYNKSEWVKRNNVESFTYSEAGGIDVKLNDTELAEYKQFLQLKLLKNNYFKLYLSNFELSTDGSILDSISEKRVRVVDINGKEYAERGYVVNTKDNKQIAFNNLAKTFTDKFKLVVTNGIEIIDASTEINEEKGYIKFVINATEDTGSGPIYLSPKDENSTIFSSQIKSQMASSVINHLEMYSVNFEENDWEQYNSLDASYISDVSSEQDKGKVKFQTVTIDESNGSVQKTPYNPKNASAISYSVSTNLGVMDNGIFTIDTSIVDPSQAIYDEEIEGVTNIKTYIDYYTQKSGEGVSSIKTTYSNVTKFAVLAEELTITRTEYDGNFVWIIGDSIFDNPQSDYIEINGVKYYDNEYPVKGSFKDGSAKIVFPANTYFPVVTKLIKNDHGESVQQQTMYMLGEPFVLETIQNANNDYTVFYLRNVDGAKSESKTVTVVDSFNIEAKDVNGNIEKKKYSSSNYITVSNGGENFELTTGEDTTYIYYENEASGQYKYDKDTMSFTLIDDPNYSGVRYSREGQSGVIVYLFVTFEFGESEGSNITMNKILTFTLKQPNLNFKFLISGEDSLNSRANPLVVNAGETTTVSLNSNGTYPTINADDNNVFRHINIVNNITGVTITKSAQNDQLIIDVGNFGSEVAQSFKITYRFKDKIVENEYFIKIMPNYNFEFNGDSDGDYYNLILDAYGVNSITSYTGTVDDSNKLKTYDIVGSLFSGSGYSNVTLTLTDLGARNARFESNKFILGVSTIKNGANNEYLEFSIKIKVGDDDITLSKKLRIEIMPTYKIEVSEELKNNSESVNTIFNGTDLTDYITVYSYNEDKKQYTDMATVPSDTVTISTNVGTITNGVINVYTSAIPSSDTLVKLTFVYGSTTEERYVKVYGIRMFYSSTGTLSADTTFDSANVDTTLTDIATIEGTNITLEVEADTTSISLDNYFAFYTTDGTKLNVVLVENNTDYRNTIDASGIGKTYRICFELNEHGTPKYKTDSNKTITISYASES